MAFTPLDSNFIFSTIVSEGPDVVATWVLLLASKDKFHESELQAPAVAKLLGSPVERADAAFEILSSPDLRSRNREYEGRRIIRQPSGTWLIVTGEKVSGASVKGRSRGAENEVREKQSGAPSGRRAGRLHLRKIRMLQRRLPRSWPASEFARRMH